MLQPPFLAVKYHHEIRCISSDLAGEVSEVAWPAGTASMAEIVGSWRYGIYGEMGKKLWEIILIWYSMVISPENIWTYGQKYGTNVYVPPYIRILKRSPIEHMRKSWNTYGKILAKTITNMVTYGGNVWKCGGKLISLPLGLSLSCSLYLSINQQIHQLFSNLCGKHAGMVITSNQFQPLLFSLNGKGIKHSNWEHVP